MGEVLRRPRLLIHGIKRTDLLRQRVGPGFDIQLRLRQLLHGVDFIFVLRELRHRERCQHHEIRDAGIILMSLVPAQRIV